MQAGTQPPLWARRLRHHRTLRAWSQHDLANELNRLDPQARLDSNTVSRWERGIYKPSPFYVRLVGQCFDVSPAELALVEVEPEESAADRQDSFQSESLGLVAAAMPWDRVAFALDRLGGVDRQVAEALEEVTMALERLYRQLPPTAVVGPAAGHLNSVTTLLESSMPTSLRRRLCSIGGETAGLVAAAKAGSGDVESAGRYLETALRLAWEADDRALGAFVVASITCAHPSQQMDPEVRLRHFTEGGFGFAVRDASPQTQVWLAAKAADIHAVMGREKACYQALDRAHAALRRAGHTDGSDGRRPRLALSSWDERWLAGETGASQARLGDSDQARQALDLALCWMDPELNNDRRWLHLAKARTYLHDQEPEQACELASHVLAAAAQTGHAALLGAVRSLRRDLERWREESAVRALDEQLAATEC